MQVSIENFFLKKIRSLMNLQGKWFLVQNIYILLPIYRPLSKTVRFNVLKVIPAGSSGGGGKKAFVAM